MTHILESWEDFIEYAGFCRYGAYQIIRYGENKAEVRVLAGKFGYVMEYELNDPDSRKTYEQVIRYVQEHGFMKVASTVPEEQFFR